MFVHRLNLKPLLLVTSIFFSLTVFNFMAVKLYVNDTKSINQNTLKKVPTTLPQIAITFDDGPHPVITPQILAILKEKNAKGTFFILGRHAEANPELIKQIASEGHEIGNHTYSHQRMTRLSHEGIQAELQHTDTILFNITGQRTKLVRPPDNGYNAGIVSLLKQCGFYFVLWSVDTRDWTNAPSSAILQQISKAGPGDIILFHDGVTPSHVVEALTQTIDVLQAKGYQLVTVSELLNGSNL